MNKAILMGRLTREPELRYSTSGNNTAVCRFSIAVDRRFQKPGEERQADFIPIVAFGKTGEFCGKYFTKGMRVAIVGTIQTRTWDDAEGKKHYTTEVIVDEAHFADGKRSEGGGFEARPASQGATGGNDGFYQMDEDDELPF